MGTEADESIEAARKKGHAAAPQKEAPEKEKDPFRLRLSKDRMHLLLDCDCEGRDLDSLAEAILNRMMLFGVRRPPTVDRIRAWLLENSRESPQIQNRSIVQGTPPQPPVDGRIEWHGDFFNTGFLVDEATGRINFRKRAAERNVKADQLLATIVSPVAGKNGIDVTSGVMRVRKPRSVRIRLGPNVREDQGSASYYAEKDGRFRFASEFLAVDEFYEIKGNVGLETGDVSHQGAVLVHGDILEGARLEAQGDVEVLGIVDGAHVQTGGLLNVHGGITGRKGVRVIAAGGIHAKYILDAHIQSNGDVVVEKEVMHSTIATRGAVYVPQGRIVGGHAVALGGFDVGQIGSAASSPTELVTGEDYSLEGRVAILKNRLRQKEENLKRVKATIGSIRGKVAALPQASKDAIRKLLANLPAMEKSLKEAAEEYQEVRAQSRDESRHVILARRLVYPESRLTIRGTTLHVREEVTGPARPVFVDGVLRLTATKMRTITGQEGDGEPAVKTKAAPNA